MVEVTTTWLLFVILSTTSGTGGLSTETFVSKKSCEVVAEELKEEWPHVTTLCIPKYK